MVRIVWTLSNLLSLSRIALLIPILYLLLYSSPLNRLAAVALMVFSALTDYFDGWTARRLHQETEAGRILDPLADKICAGTVAIVLAALGDVPIWFVASVIARDSIILLGGLYVAKTKNVVLQSTWPGKITMGVVAVYLILATVRSERLAAFTSIFLWGSVAFLGISLLAYTMRFFETISVKQKTT
jgi:CDP-diacylglycerol--glycerol-3-phosphate 3-phosphatidyltransferase